MSEDPMAIWEKMARPYLQWIDIDGHKQVYMNNHAAHELAMAAQDLMVELTKQRDLAIAHDRQPYPTADAYEKVCAALHKKEGELHDAVARAHTYYTEKVRAEKKCTDYKLQIKQLRAELDARGLELQKEDYLLAETRKDLLRACEIIDRVLFDVVDKADLEWARAMIAKLETP
jgi:hypothetical protein